MTFWKGFSAYATIGVVNTLIHAQVFFVLHMAAEFSQALSNFVAFCVAGSFSFYVNVLYTFDSHTSRSGYAGLMGLMCIFSYGIGYVADIYDWPGLWTVCSFTLISLLFGLVFSRFSSAGARGEYHE